LHFFVRKEVRPPGVYPPVHGSHPPPSHEQRRGVDLLDIALLLLPLVLAVATFALANLT
jgi:hypothetical protein